MQDHCRKKKSHYRQQTSSVMWFLLLVSLIKIIGIKRGSKRQLVELQILRSVDHYIHIDAGLESSCCIEFRIR